MTITLKDMASGVVALKDVDGFPFESMPPQGTVHITFGTGNIASMSAYIDDFRDAEAILHANGAMGSPILPIIISIMPVILQIWQGCDDGDDVALASKIRNPGRLEVRVLGHALGEQRGMNLRERIRNRKQLQSEVRDRAASLSDEDVQSIIMEIRKAV